MALRSSSARSLRQIHRDLDRRRELAVEAKGRVSNKTSGSPAKLPPRSALTPTPHGASPAAPVSFMKGDEVRVRTPVGRLLPSTLRLVIRLGAVVVSDSNDVQVIYNGNFPRDAPFRVATTDVKFPAVDNTAPLPSGSMAARRPTTAGKSVPLLKKPDKEMRAKSEAFLAS